MVSDVPNVFIGEVNCEEENELCSQQGVKSYPTIRLYPLQSSNLNTVAWVSLQSLVFNILSNLSTLETISWGSSRAAHSLEMGTTWAVAKRLYCADRIGHKRHAHDFLMKHTESSVCAVCDGALTVEHILLSCCQYSRTRKRCRPPASLS